jgi:uncharacterized membrane protein YsdA (DUF1294 family)
MTIDDAYQAAFAVYSGTAVIVLIFFKNAKRTCQMMQKRCPEQFLMQKNYTQGNIGMEEKISG